MGPVATQMAIKQLGTNGGGFFNVNAAHPFENPTALANALEIWQMLVISTALVFAFGRLIGDRRQARALLAAIAIILVAGIGIAYWAESAGTPSLLAAGIDPTGGNMEGKEVRFGLAASSMFAAVTTGLSDGAVNAMHGSFTPIGG
ncbi:MAG: kdpA, partial [Xanthobacteraceae bacterium]|nr:kdpA [Xanthobacteraceae bacterium]